MFNEYDFITSLMGIRVRAKIFQDCKIIPTSVSFVFKTDPECSE